MPLVYSEQKAKDKKIGWHRCGENIKYYRSQRNVFLNDARVKAPQRHIAVNSDWLLKNIVKAPIRMEVKGSNIV